MIVVPHTRKVPTTLVSWVWTIDEVKRVSRLEQLHVVGVDPGKLELVVGVDMDNPKGFSPVRYAQKQRTFETCSKQYIHEEKRKWRRLSLPTSTRARQTS